MAKIIDSDAHVVAPRALWEEYVEPAFRDRIPKAVKDADGRERGAVLRDS